MNETIYLKKIGTAGNQTDSHTSAYSKNHDAAQSKHFHCWILENELDTVDKSTIYRTINPFFSPSFGSWH